MFTTSLVELNNDLLLRKVHIA